MADSVAMDKVARMVREAVDLTERERTEAEKDRDYYDGEQWTAPERAALAKRGQPDVAFNLIQRKIDAIVGVEQRTRTDPRAYPRNPNDEKSAHAVTDAVRYVVDNNRFDSLKSAVFENQLVEGCGAVEVCLEPQASGEMEIKLKRIRWENYIRDPRSREPDFSDAAYHGVLKWMDEADAVALSPDNAEQIKALIEAGTGRALENHGSHADRPDWGQWVDRRRRRVQVAQVYYRNPDDTWNYALNIGGQTFIDEPSYYVDEQGRPSCPIEAVSGYVDRENRRYGVVRSMRGPQDEINHRRSKLLHFMNQRRVIAEQGAVKDPDQARAELARPDGYVEVTPGMQFDVLPGGEQAAGQAELLAHATQELERMGPNAAIQGEGPGSASGRAIVAQQQAGMTQLSPLFDRLNDWAIRVYRQIWYRIKQAWTAPKWVRVTDDENTPRFVGLNQPVQDPFGNVVAIENHIPELDMDIVVSTSPDVTVLQGEQFEKIMALAPALASAGMPIPPKLLIQMSDLKDKEAIIAQWDEQSAAMQQQQEQMRMMELAKQQSEAAKRQAETQKTLQEARKTAVEADGEGMENLIRLFAAQNPEPIKRSLTV